MIRRSFWMSVGALLGVTGYRRVSRLARSVTAGRRGAAPARARDRGRGREWTQGAALFARDVRDGMELYADRHPRLAARTLEGQQARAPRPRLDSPGRAYPGVD